MTPASPSRLGENYTIFLPLTFDLTRVADGNLPFFFDQDRPARYGVVKRHGDHNDIHWFEGPPCYMFHTLNAFEQGNEIILVGCRNESTTTAAPPGHFDQDPGHSQL